MKSKDLNWLSENANWTKIIRENLYPPETQVLEPAIKSILNKENLKNKSILDAGCGEGRFTKYMQSKGVKVTALDISRSHIDQIIGKSINRVIGDVKDLNFQDEIFDYVLCVGILTLIDDYKKAFKEFHRVLKDGGNLIYAITHPCFENWPIDDKFTFSNSRDYFTERKIPWKCQLTNGKTIIIYDIHRPLSAYFKAMNNLFFTKTVWEPKSSNEVYLKYWKEKQYAEVEYLIVKAVKQK